MRPGDEKALCVCGHPMEHHTGAIVAASCMAVGANGVCPCRQFTPAEEEARMRLRDHRLLCRIRHSWTTKSGPGYCRRCGKLKEVAR